MAGSVMGRFFSVVVVASAVAIAGCSSSDSSGSKPRDAGADASGGSGAFDSGADAFGGAGSGGSAGAVDGGDADAADAAPAFGVISQSSASSFESESHLVVAADGRTVAVWMALGAGLKNGFAISENRGSTWAPPATMSVASKGDPILATTSDGSFYYGYLDGTCTSAGVCTGGHVWIARLPPLATTFEAPVDVSPADPQEFYDKPWLMTAADGSLVAIFNGRIGAYPTNVDTIVAARSSDGKSWTRSYVVPKQPPGQIAGIPHACSSTKSPRIWTVYVDLSSPVAASMRWSDDHGATWPSTNVSSGFALASELTKLQSYDLRCTGEGDSVFLMYGLASGPSSAGSIPPLDEIHVSHSPDGGKSWDATAVISKAGTQFLRPEIVLEPDGALDVIAYSGTGEGDQNGAVLWFRSTDGGKSFSEKSVIHAPILFTGSRATNAWIGDYSGLVVDNGELFVTYADNSSGKAHVAFYRAPVK